MAAPTKQAVEVARQFRKALALDLVTRTAQNAYDALAETVAKASKVAKEGGVLNRQQIDACKVILSMANVLEPAKELEDRDVSKLNLHDLNKMIEQLRIIEPIAGDAPLAAHDDSQVIDIFS